ncbi:hypothetical protein LLG46_10815 [bacterium]|nr:hypothetical protein [bacterium]
MGKVFRLVFELAFAVMLIMTSVYAAEEEPADEQNAAISYKLEFKDSETNKRAYKAEIDLEDPKADGGTLSVHAWPVFVETVTAAKDNAAMLSYAVREGNVTLDFISGGNKSSAYQGPIGNATMSYSRAPQGKVSDIEIDKNMNVLFGKAGAYAYCWLGLEFPDRELKIGDKWTVKGSDSITIDYMLSDKGELGDIKYLKINGTITKLVSSLSDARQDVGSIIILFDYPSGEIFKSEVKIDGLTMSLVRSWI